MNYANMNSPETHPMITIVLKNEQTGNRAHVMWIIGDTDVVVITRVSAMGNNGEQREFAAMSEAMEFAQHFVGIGC